MQQPVPPLVVFSFIKRLAAVNAHTGQRVWEFETGTNLGRLLVTDGLVIYVADRSIFCLDYVTGALRWKAPIPITPSDTNMLVYAGCVVVTSLGEAACLALANGAQIWHEKFKGFGSASGAMAAPGVAAQLGRS